MVSPEELESAKRVLSWIQAVKTWALALVAFGVALEFLTDRIERPYQRRIEAAHEEEMQRLKQAAERERIARIQLEAQIQPRSFTEEQESGITGAMKPFAGRDLLIASHWIDAEGAQLASQIKSALNRAGIGLTSGPPLDLIGKYPRIALGLFGGGEFAGTEIHTGVEVWGTDREAVAAALSSIGKLAVTTPPQSEYPFDIKRDRLIAVFVGVKPLPIGTK